MVIVVGCGLTPGESLVGNAKRSDTGQKMSSVQSVTEPGANFRNAGSQTSTGGCYVDSDCANNQYCKDAKNAANPKYSQKGVCVSKGKNSLDSTCTKNTECSSQNCVKEKCAPQVSLTPNPPDPAIPESNTNEAIHLGTVLVDDCVNGQGNWKDGKTYVLDKDISLTQANPKSDPVCFRMENVKNVVFDCSRHKISSPEQGKGSGIFLFNVDNVTIKGCTIENFKQGIGLLSASKVKIINNYFQSDTTGINLGDSQGVNPSSELYVYGNIFDKNKFGIELYGLDGKMYILKENKFSDTATSFFFYSKNEVYVLANEIKGGESGIIATNTNKLIIRDNNLKKLSNHGILLDDDVKGIEIDFNTIESKMEGIKLYFDLKPIIVNNNVCSSQIGDLDCTSNTPYQGKLIKGNKFKTIGPQCKGIEKGIHYISC